MTTPACLPDEQRSEALEWARKSRVPLQFAALAQSLGDARVVAFGEGAHLAAEVLELRNRLFQYLVEEKGFTAIAIESGLVEGRTIYDFCRGGRGELEAVLAQGLSWTFDRLPQNRELVAWIREYNAARGAARPINFYGFDVPGSPGNAHARRGLDTAWTEALAYVHSVDRKQGSVFEKRIAPLRPYLKFALQSDGSGYSYDRLDREQRDALTATLADLIAFLESNETRLTAASSPGEFKWAYRAAIGARQTDTWLRHIPVSWRPAQEPHADLRAEDDFLATATDSRDRAQADNLDWILSEEGAQGKLLIYASRYHLSAATISRPIWPHRHEVAGTYLRRRLGSQLVIIGNLIGRGSVGSGSEIRQLEPASPSSMDGFAVSLNEPRWWLDLRRAPKSVAPWFERERSFGEGAATFSTRPREAYDILLYLDTVRPACGG